jgi:osomolarity two-component system, sensor histidine kinase SLN1
MRIPLRYLSERAASTASSHRSHSKASSLVGQTLHDDDPVLHHPHGGSATSLASTHPAHPQDEKYRTSSALADVPRIVGFSQPYVAKETTPEDKAQARLNEMKKAESEAVKQGKKVRVLVAEDNPVNQEVVLRMLKLESVYGKCDLALCNCHYKLTKYRRHDRKRRPRGF